jgi:hypothetical protein
MTRPVLHHIRQNLRSLPLADVEATVRERLFASKLLDRISPGSRVIIAAGSRGIPNYPRVIRVLVKCLKDRGAAASIMPAMGSHGGGTPSGQATILRELGVTEDTVGAPVVQTMEPLAHSTTASGMTLWVDRCLLESDLIVVVNRIDRERSSQDDGNWLRQV